MKWRWYPALRWKKGWRRAYANLLRFGGWRVSQCLCEPSSRSFRRGRGHDGKRRRYRSGRTTGRENAGWNAIPRRRFRGRSRVSISRASANSRRVPRKARERCSGLGLGRLPLRGLLFTLGRGRTEIGGSAKDKPADFFSPVFLRHRLYLFRRGLEEALGNHVHEIARSVDARE